MAIIFDAALSEPLTAVSLSWCMEVGEAQSKPAGGVLQRPKALEWIRYGVQGVASSNLVAPTIISHKNKHLER